MTRFIFLALFMALLTADEAFSDQAPPGVQILSVKTQGTGCDSNANSVLTPDGKTLSLLFDHYIAQTAATSAAADRKNCDVDVQFSIPAGYSFALFSADYRGFAAVDEGAMAVHEVVYSFPGAQHGAFSSSLNPPFPGGPVGHPPIGTPVQQIGHYSFSARVIQGPYNADYSIHNELSAQNLAWSPCGSSNPVLRLATALLARSTAPARNGQFATSMVSLDSVDASIQQTFGITWRRCNLQNPIPPIHGPGPHCNPSIPGSCSPAFPPKPHF